MLYSQFQISIPHHPFYSSLYNERQTLTLPKPKLPSLSLVRYGLSTFILCHCYLILTISQPLKASAPAYQYKLVRSKGKSTFFLQLYSLYPCRTQSLPHHWGFHPRSHQTQILGSEVFSLMTSPSSEWQEETVLSLFSRIPKAKKHTCSFSALPKSSLLPSPLPLEQFTTVPYHPSKSIPLCHELLQSFLQVCVSLSTQMPQFTL